MYYGIRGNFEKNWRNIIKMSKTTMSLLDSLELVKQEEIVEI